MKEKTARLVMKIILVCLAGIAAFGFISQAATVSQRISHCQNAPLMYKSNCSTTFGPLTGVGP